MSFVFQDVKLFNDTVMNNIRLGCPCADDGRLTEYGTHDELMKKSDLYHKLFRIQQENLGWTL